MLVRNWALTLSVIVKFLATVASAVNALGERKLNTPILPRVPPAGSAKPPAGPLSKSDVPDASTNGLKNFTVCVTGSSLPAPTWNDPGPLFGRQMPTSCSDPHSLVLGVQGKPLLQLDRKSTRLNSSHTVISYAVFCLKKKN